MRRFTLEATNPCLGNLVKAEGVLFSDNTYIVRWLVKETLTEFFDHPFDFYERYGKITSITWLDT